MVKSVPAPGVGLKALMALAVALAVSVGMASATTAASPRPTPRQIDAYVENGMNALHVPGAAVALFSRGRITHVRGLGHADDAGTPVTPQTPFQLGSVSKSFAALMVLQLADEGRLSLDDPISNTSPPSGPGTGPLRT